MTRLHIFTLLLGVAVGFTSSHAQTASGSRARQGLDAFRREAHQEFDTFRKQAMDEYAAFVRNAWKEFDHTPAVPVPEEEPVPPVVMPEEDRDQSPLNRPIAIDDIIRPVVVQPQPVPVFPVIEVPQPEMHRFGFTFFGTDAKVRFDTADRIHMTGVQGTDVADALEQLSDARYDNMIVDCLALRDTLRLCDWAYLQMLKALADTIQGQATNEAAVLLGYLYMQSGYRMRFGTDGTRLYMLYATPHMVYDHVSYGIDGERYYGVEQLPSRLFVCEAAYPKERSMSLLVTTRQLFADDRTEPRRIVSKRYADCSFTATVNRNLLRFYDTYPTSMTGDDMMTRWAMYANTPMEQGVCDELYPQMRERLKGLSQTEAVERLLNWVQTGLEYEYDDKVWGDDRAFFPEETLFYPYCDCEDRAILLTRLLRDLLGLRCVLVYYPGHLASAVELTEGEVQGDYIMHNGHRYVIADGTYINAPLGRTMPGMSNATAKVILLAAD